MSGYSFFNVAVIVVAGLIAGYIVLRVLTYGALRSYFEAKLWFLDKLKKGDGNHGSSK